MFRLFPYFIFALLVLQLAPVVADQDRRTLEHRIEAIFVQGNTPPGGFAAEAEAQVGPAHLILDQCNAQYETWTPGYFDLSGSEEMPDLTNQLHFDFSQARLPGELQGLYVFTPENETRTGFARASLILEFPEGHQAAWENFPATAPELQYANFVFMELVYLEDESLASELLGALWDYQSNYCNILG